MRLLIFGYGFSRPARWPRRLAAEGWDVAATSAIAATAAR